MLTKRGIAIPESVSKTRMNFDPDSDEYYLNRVKVLNDTAGKLTGYNCSKCKNKGVIYTLSENRREINSRDCSCLEIRREIQRIKDSGLENLSKKCTFRNYKVTEKWQGNTKERAKRFVDQYSESWFFIGGQCGCGKTHLCTAICTELMKRGLAVRYMVWNEEVQRLKSFINETAFDSMIKPFLNIGVLYIDDFFKTKKGESVTTADVNMAYKIINHRYNANKTTIISSELSTVDIIAIDEALGSRIVEMVNDKYNIFIKPDPKKNYRYKKEDFI